MGYTMFFGCLFLTYGPAAAIFFLSIANSPQLVILTIGSAFFWLTSILLSSIWWYIIKPLRGQHAWTIFSSVLIQEIIRLGFLKLYTKAESGFIQRKAQQTTHLTTHPDQFKASIALGLGAGVAQSMVTYLAILWQSTGPGDYFSPSCPGTSIFITSALYSFCFILFHVFWSILALEAFKERAYLRMGVVVLSHYIASYLTMLNLEGASCIAGLVLEFVHLIAVAAYTWIIVSRSAFAQQKSNVRPYGGVGVTPSINQRSESSSSNDED